MALPLSCPNLDDELSNTATGALQMSCVATILGGDPAGDSFWPILLKNSKSKRRRFSAGCPSLVESISVIAPDFTRSLILNFRLQLLPPTFDLSEELRVFQ